jgi:hypothetical protein
LNEARILSSFRQSSSRPTSTVLLTRRGQWRRLTGTPSGAASGSSAVMRWRWSCSRLWRDLSTVPGSREEGFLQVAVTRGCAQARNSSALRRGIRVVDREHERRRGDLIHGYARAGTRDRRPGRSRTPAGSGSSWVCRSPATTSRRPVFRGRLQRRRTYGSLIATDDGPEPHRPAIRHRSPEAVEFVKSNAPEQTGEPAGEANQFAPAAGRA